MIKENRNISVVLPIYNGQDTIKDVLDGIFNQNKNSRIKEIVIVNDGSTDQSELIIKKIIDTYKGNIEVIYIYQENQGVSYARNTGIERATGEWIAFCDSDDKWLPKKIEQQLQIIEENPDLEFLGGYVFKNEFNIFGKKFEGTFVPTLRQMLVKSFPWPSTVIMKRYIYEEIGGFEVGRNHGEDTLYFLKIHNLYKFYFDTTQVAEIGFGKKAFGESGLSGDLEGMYEGTVNNLYTLLKTGRIGKKQYILFKLFYYLKHIRRKILTRFN